MDIGIIAPALSQYGGAERLVVECAARWQDAHQVTLYAPGFNRPYLREHGVDLNKTRLVSLSTHGVAPPCTLMQLAFAPRVWEKEIDEHDVYLASGTITRPIDRHPLVWYPHEPFRYLHDLRYMVPAVPEITEHLARDLASWTRGRHQTIGSATGRTIWELIEVLSRMGRPDRVVANSRASARYLEEVYGTPVDAVVYPGVCLPDEPRSFDEPRFVVVGRLTLVKRLRLVLEALRLVDDVQLTVIGDGPERRDLRRMADGLDVAGRVQFLDGLSNRELQGCLARCLATIFVPVREPFGIAALESLAAGKPLIGVEEGGFTEVVNESCAFLVPPRPLAIAERMRYLRDHPDVARRMGDAGREVARQLTWERTAAHLLDICTSARRTVRDERTAVQDSGSDRLPLFGIEYFCWYRNGKGAAHWHDPPHHHGVRDMPALGYYSSCEGTVLADHLRAVAAAGFDFLVINLHAEGIGADGNELLAVEHLLGTATQIDSPLRFCMRIHAGREARATAAELLLVTARVWARRPTYLRHQGGAVVLGPDLEDDRIEAICRQHDLVRPVTEPGGSPVLVGLHLAAAAGPSASTQARIEAVQAAAHGAMSVNACPDMIVLHSFNNYHDGSYVEESLDHGSALLHAARNLILAVRRRSAPVRVPASSPYPETVAEASAKAANSGKAF